MFPAVEPSPVEPIVLLAVAAAAVAVEEVDVAARSEKRLVEPRVAPRLLAGELVAAAPEVSEEDDVLVAVLVETIVVVEAATEEVRLAAFEAFELLFRDDTLLPLPLPRSPRNRGAMTAAKRSAWIAPARRIVRCKGPKETTAVRTTAAEGPDPSLLAAERARFQYTPAPAINTSASAAHHDRCDRGLGGAGRTISGRDLTGSGRAGLSPGFGTDTLPISQCL
jgi:hypothetical protein